MVDAILDKIGCFEKLTKAYGELIYENVDMQGHGCRLMRLIEGLQ